jgi:hypothetical protein
MTFSSWSSAAYFRKHDNYTIKLKQHPEPEFRHQPANAGKVVFPKGDVAMSNDRQIPSNREILAEVESRNILRKRFGLPPVELQRELDRIQIVREGWAFQDLMQSPLRYRVERKLLQRLRRRRGNLAWTPTGVLSGGGLVFHTMLIKQMRRLRERLAESAGS